MSLLKKSNEFLVHFPINIEHLIALTQDQKGLHDQNCSYYGPVKDTKKHGSYGVLIQKKNNDSLHIRQGEWKNDKFTGKGSYYVISKAYKNQNPVIIWKQGNWVMGRMKGKGLIKEYNFAQQAWKVVYVGQFAADQKHGSGIAYFDDKYYQGNFKGGCFDGQGRLIKNDDNYQDGTFYKGQFLGRGIQRRDSEFVVYDKYNQYQVYSTPFDKDNLPSFYQNLIRRLCSDT